MTADGPVAVVTGATRGIGRAVALSLAAAGRRVLAVGRDREALVSLAKQGGAAVHALDVDLVDLDSVSRVVEAADKQGGARELVCCAGIARYQPVGSIDSGSLRAQLTVNLEAPLLLAQALGMRMAQGEGGAVVFVSSTLAAQPAPHTTAYAASKAGLEAAARGLALELAPGRVRVNVVAPGVVDTAMVRAPRNDGLDAETRLEALRQMHPLGRLGTPEEVAAAVRYLLEAPWITGSVLRIDGGLSLG